MGNNSIDVLDVLLVLAKRKKFIIITTLLVTIFIVVYSLLATQYWKSSVSFLTITQDRSAIPLAGSLLGGFGSALLGQDMTGNTQNFINIMRSRTFSEKIVNKFDLAEYFKIKDDDPLVVMEMAVKQLNETVLEIETDIETSMLTITIETKDRYFSRDIAQTYFDMLEEYYLTTKMSKGRERRIFLEKQIADFEDNFALLTRKMADFQEEYQIVEMKTQTEAIVSLYSEIVARQMETEIELNFAQQNFSDDSPVVLSLKDRLAVLNRSIREMETSAEGLRPRYMVNIDDLPNIGSQYAQLTLNLEVQKKVIEFLYPQYEQAKLDELSDISSFEIIDRAVPAGLRSRPRRARMVIIAFALSLFLSSLGAYTYEVFTNTSRKEKVDSIIKELLGK